MAGNHNEIEKRLWDATDELRDNYKIKSSEYSVPVLGLILRYADHKFTHDEKELAGPVTVRCKVGKTDYLVPGERNLLCPLNTMCRRFYGLLIGLVCLGLQNILSG